MFVNQLRLPACKQSLVFKVVARPLSVFYSGVITLRNLLFDAGIFSQKKLPGTVISIGNIVAGGTGKTPLTIFIAEQLKSAGAKPVILTRGYRSGLRRSEYVVLYGDRIVVAPKSHRKLFADEARMQAIRLRNVAVVVGQSRYKAAMAALEQIEYEPSHWILDDGFQHRQIVRDFDVVLIDGQEPFSNGQLLPSGLLRESIASLKRADHIVVNNTTSADDFDNIAQQIGDMNKKINIDYTQVTLEPIKPAFSAREFSLELARLKGVTAVCAIAKPERFFSSLGNLHIPINRKIVLSDHARFDMALGSINHQRDQLIITTEKDFWRDPDVFLKYKNNVFVLPISMTLRHNLLINDLVKTLK